MEKARYFAIASHGNQTYEGLPYFYHLEEVVDILIEFGFTQDAYMMAGYCHDILEDCPISYNDIKENFGLEVAEIVYCVTDELGRNRKERKLKTYPKIATNRKAIIVKLADRIANMRNTGSMLDMYKKEHSEFKSALHFANHSDNKIQKMWNALEEMIER